MPDDLVKPHVSVLMAVHNGGAFVRDAIESILAQDYREFCFIIVDDGSTDGTADTLRAFRDPRLHLVTNTSNLGLARSLNRGLSFALTPYIARMDADDVALPTRLGRQVAFMEATPEVHLCGSWYERMDDRTHLCRLPTDNASIKLRLLTESAFGHPTVMFRREVVPVDCMLYDESYDVCQDYRLWTCLAPAFTFANIPESLLRYRWHSDNVSIRRADRADVLRRRIHSAFLSAILGREMPQGIAETLVRFIADPEDHHSDLRAVSPWLGLLLDALPERLRIPQKAAQEYLATRWLRALVSHSALSPRDATLLVSPLARVLPFATRLRYLAKCLLCWRR